MGSACRTERCDKFIKEFNSDYVNMFKKIYGFPDGNITELYLDFNDLDETVVMIFELKSPTNMVFTVQFPCVIYNPDCDDMERHVEKMCEMTLGNNLEECEIQIVRNRFIKAGLI